MSRTEKRKGHLKNQIRLEEVGFEFKKPKISKLKRDSKCEKSVYREDEEKTCQSQQTYLPK